MRSTTTPCSASGRCQRMVPVVSSPPARRQPHSIQPQIFDQMLEIQRRGERLESLRRRVESSSFHAFTPFSPHVPFRRLEVDN